MKSYGLLYVEFISLFHSSPAEAGLIGLAFGIVAMLICECCSLRTVHTLTTHSPHTHHTLTTHSPHTHHTLITLTTHSPHTHHTPTTTHHTHTIKAPHSSHSACTHSPQDKLVTHHTLTTHTSTLTTLIILREFSLKACPRMNMEATQDENCVPLSDLNAPQASRVLSTSTHFASPRVLRTKWTWQRIDAFVFEIPFRLKRTRFAYCGALFLGSSGEFWADPGLGGAYHAQVPMSDPGLGGAYHAQVPMSDPGLGGAPLLRFPWRIQDWEEPLC